MGLTRRTASDADAAVAAELVLTLAVLLQAGVAPRHAWTHLADRGDAAAERVVAAVDAGVDLPRAIAASAPQPERPRRRVRSGGRRRGGGQARAVEPDRAAASGDAAAWGDVAAAWSVAIAVGAPLAGSLRGLALALRDAREAADEIRVALAEPAGTARLMVWLPLVGVALGVALGFDTIGVLLGQPLGFACLVVGAALIVVARRWNRALVRAASADLGIPGMDADLLAIALTGGVSIDRARHLVAHAHGRPCDARAEAILELSHAAGVPAAELLRASASLARIRARVEGRMRAAKLSTTLLLPLGVCTLPAFLLLGVAPMLLSIVSAASLSL